MLMEIYDASPSPLTAPQRLINISARGSVNPGAGALIAGFVIGGTASKTVLDPGDRPRPRCLRRRRHAGRSGAPGVRQRAGNLISPRISPGATRTSAGANQVAW